MVTGCLLANQLIYFVLLDSALVAAWQWTGVVTDSTTEPTTRTETCKVDEVLCSDGTCMPPEWICDYFKDCPRGEDEAKALCGIGHTISKAIIVNLDQSTLPQTTASSARRATITTARQTLGPAARQTTLSSQARQTSTVGSYLTSTVKVISKTTTKPVPKGKILLMISENRNNTQTVGATNVNTTDVTINRTGQTETLNRTEPPNQTEPPNSGYEKLEGMEKLLALAVLALFAI